MEKQDSQRDEYLLHDMPKHTFAEYVVAHQLAGDLEFAPDPKPYDPKRYRK